MVSLHLRDLKESSITTPPFGDFLTFPLGLICVVEKNVKRFLCLYLIKRMDGHRRP
jgi:hypothetical protein